MEHEFTQSNVISHEEQMKQAEVYRAATMAGHLAAATNPSKVIKTREEREAQRAANEYMNKNPYAPETKLARFFNETLHTGHGAEYDDHALNNAKQLRESVNNVNGHYLDGHDLGAALAITAAQYAYSTNNGRSEKDVDFELESKLDNKMKGTVAILKNTDTDSALHGMSKDCAQYGASYSNNHDQVGPIDNSFITQPTGSAAARDHTLTIG